MIKGEVQGDTLLFSVSNVPQISLDVGAHPYMAMPAMKFANMVMCYVSYLYAYVQKYIQYIKLRAILIAFWLMFLNDRPLSTWDNYDSCLIKCQLWATYNRHYK